MKNFAHRGFSGKYPENTMLAFTKAVEAGADGIELDVQLTKDGQLVIIHDESIDRTTNGTGRVKDFNYKEISAFNASYIYRDSGFNKIPTLEEYFEFVKDKNIITNIELKTGVFEYLGIEQKVYDLICKYSLKNKVIISSFNHFSIMRMRKIAPELEYGLLSETWLINAGKYVHDLGIPCYHPLFRNLTDEVVKELKEYGIKINTYTVNTKEDILDMQKKGIDIVISNFPNLVKEVLNSQAVSDK